MDGNFVWLLVPTRLISDFRLVATYVRLEESRWDICSMMNRPIGIQPFSEKAICGFKMLITLHPMGLKFCLSCVMWTFSTIFILCMGTLSRLLLAENQDIKFLWLFAKMTGKGGASYWHQPNFEEIGLVDKRPFFTTLRAFSAHFYQAELQANWRQICLLVLGKSVRKMCQLHIQKINKVWICFGLFCSILHIHSNAYTCIDLYVYQ